jgi:hypothetical protein
LPRDAKSIEGTKWRSTALSAAEGHPICRIELIDIASDVQHQQNHLSGGRHGPVPNHPVGNFP